MSAEAEVTLVAELDGLLDDLGVVALSQPSKKWREKVLDVEFPARLEHTILHPDAHHESITRVCEEVCEHGLRGVCVNPIFVKDARQILEGCPSQLVVTVVGFPLGASQSETKESEARRALHDGADEFDMVLPLGLLVEGDYRGVFRDIEAVVGAVAGNPVKVILETGLLQPRDIIAGCLIAQRAGASVIKTSTGFAFRRKAGERDCYASLGATPADVALIRRIVGQAIGIKAAGGIRTVNQANELIAAGADVLGASSSVELVHEWRNASGSS